METVRKYARTVAMVRRQASARSASGLRPVFGVDRMLNPDVEAADAIYRAVEHGAAGNVIGLEGGRGILELAVAPGSILAGVPLRELAARTKRHLLVAFVEKPGGALLPDGNTVLFQRLATHARAGNAGRGPRMR